MLQMKNSVAVLALVAVTSILPPPVLGQDQPVAEPAEDLESLVDSLSGEAAGGDVAPLPEEELLTDAELDELVAPIALYPDALLAQVLVASTYPLQIIKADRIIAESEGLSDEELSATLSDQDFDPSVLVLLSGFPTVIERMAADLDWTERLGIAMLQQDDDVLAAVQRMRADARDMGYLSSNEAQTVEEDAGEIYIAPADPEVVYVPSYDPGVVYSAPAPAQPYYVAPAQNTSPFSWQNLATTGVIAFGSALLVNELWGDDDDDDDDDWDGYWRRPRPIDWDDRDFYPRPYWNRERAEAARSWAWERDRYWRREDARWRREVARDRREAVRDRREALGYLGRDPARVRDVGPWREIQQSERRERQALRARQERREERQEALQRQERREDRQRAERQERRQEAREQAERQQRREERQQAERRQERREEAEAEARREERQRAARQEQRREEAATEARREERQRAQRQQQRQEEAAAEERRQARQRAERQEQRQKEAAAEERREARQRAERQEQRRQEAAAEERRQRQAAERAKAEQAAEQQRQRAAPERRTQRAQEAPRRQQQERASQQRGGDEARGNNQRQRQRQNDGEGRQRCREGERNCR
jgi:hypothetical protein